ncbi:uncharacterized protein ANIA_11544 [Aspergillus nidulans FGSC A4]|uniref:Uncharacterized protein n=1 Tax=Emericella nidulans (strain FGSC A4 / ATCC 38163 / CBS 112.46 / NRRL 194 / M139) TaxID=227321 RepID=C8VDB1_EMENI|nr:hypothetical protein [Aspergillus nidulans FGSC A4]CBF79040.1 TPA: hypothetical protein ANIA_11544 [Aspergillus nidulans FGSC A4]
MADYPPALAIDDQFRPAVQTQGSMKALFLDDSGMITNKRLQTPLAFLGVVPPRNIEVLTIMDDLALQNEDHMEK